MQRGASKPTTVAAIDCGTNTIKLLVGDLPDVAVRESRMVRLGQGVDATGRLAPEALARAFAAIDEYAALITEHGAERVRFCATSATRDADNAAEFTAGVRARLGIEPEVLSGDEEARLAFDGALRGTDLLPDPVLVLDVGGGSTELILGERPTGDEDYALRAYSMDIGSVRLHERCLGGDPATQEQIASCVSAIDAALDECPVDPAAAAAVIGIAGTVTTVAAGVLGLRAYDRDVIHGQVLDIEAVHGTVDDLVHATRAQRLALGYVHPGRADVIDAGALIVSRVLRRTTVETVTVAETDILDGIAWSLID
ncbi:exopolyphosphatase [Nocardioides sp. HM23]|uniref:Ppx/GppA phosphatase family protein n=1 Tax=Nocardioides bizhenqiangii TaxID=3095076 RepID=UPI002ACA04DC|nr:exopolyphosphatase [Nocardioides sp. HM23]MDZ5623602.1 exopolyphosphatase [Nocardioides sp. HM23]